MEQPIILAITDNLRALVWNADDNPKATIIQIQAREKEEPVGFRITTTEKVLSHFWELPQLHGENFLLLAEDILPDGYRIMIDRRFLDHPLIVGLELATESNPAAKVVKIEPWDGSGGTASMIYLETSDPTN